MIRTDDKSLCCGCGACVGVCAVQAITMQTDAMGFRYASVAEDICIGCGRCEQVCAFQKAILRSDSLSAEQPAAYAVRSRDPEALRRSTSGAAGYHLMDAFAAAGGVVYGARFDGPFLVRHERAETRADIGPLRTTKYTQSETDGVFARVQADLDAGRPVLFTGTPCQTAALAASVSGRDRLLLADVLCHGVSAPAVWRACLEDASRRYGVPVASAAFRDPVGRWSETVSSVLFADGTRRTFRHWARLYQKNLMLRPACARCPYASLHRPADVTLGDCWGIGKVRPDWAADDLGASLLLVHTAAGKAWAERLQADWECVPVPLNAVMQPSMTAPVRTGEQADAFARDFLAHGYAFVRRRYAARSLRERWRLLKWNVKRFLKRIGLWR